MVHLQPMRQLFRWFFNALAALSLAICLATAVLRAHSRRVEDRLTIQVRQPDGTYHVYLQFHSRGGELDVLAGPTRYARLGRHVTMTGPRRQWAWSEEPAAAEGELKWSYPFRRGAFAFEKVQSLNWTDSSSDDWPPASAKQYRVAFPAWSAIVLSGAGALVPWTIRAAMPRRRRRRAARGLCTACGHERTVFIVKGDLLVYAQYPRDSFGCTLVAVDVTTGEEVWRNYLLAVGSCAHSEYLNNVRLELLNDSIRAWGDESLGQDVEVVDLYSGETLAHRTFARW